MPMPFPPQPYPCPPRRPKVVVESSCSSSSCECSPDSPQRKPSRGYKRDRGQVNPNNMMFPPPPRLASMPDTGLWPHWGDGHEESSSY
jgi:hypothetical protein